MLHTLIIKSNKALYVYLTAVTQQLPRVIDHPSHDVGIEQENRALDLFPLATRPSLECRLCYRSCR